MILNEIVSKNAKVSTDLLFKQGNCFGGETSIKKEK